MGERCTCVHLPTKWAGRPRRRSVERFVMWKSAVVLQLFVVMTYKWSINLFTNPNPVYSQNTRGNINIMSLRIAPNWYLLSPTVGYKMHGFVRWERHNNRSGKNNIGCSNRIEVSKVNKQCINGSNDINKSNHNNKISNLWLVLVMSDSELFGTCTVFKKYILLSYHCLYIIYIYILVLTVDTTNIPNNSPTHLSC
jgi:hypothetical protein